MRCDFLASHEMRCDKYLTFEEMRWDNNYKNNNNNNNYNERGDYVRWGPSLVRFVSAGAPPPPTWWRNIWVACLFSSFLAKTCEPISRTMAHKMQLDVRKCPLSKCFLRVIFPRKPYNFAGSREIPAKVKKSSNS